ncbi:MAG: hypothetical protein QOI61_1582 [Actinomycetota bacterium]|jgi:plastocyanin
MRRPRLLLAVLLTVAMAGCGGGSSATRTVLVDFSSDEFASSAFFNFPGKIDATPGQTIVFKQEWTGEPHTVTGGAFVNGVLAKTKDWITFFEGFDSLRADRAVPDPESPGISTFADFVAGLKNAKDRKVAKETADAWRALAKSGVPLADIDNPPALSFADAVAVVEAESDKAFSGVPFAFDDNDGIAQNVGQPCYLETGKLPLDSAKACSKANQRQPAFDGKQSVYNSGLIRYEGVQGNSFKVPLADDIKPGTYFFYCAVHGFGQTTELIVKPKGSKIESQGSVSRRAQAEAKEKLAPVQTLYREAVRSGRLTVAADEVQAPFAGLYSPGGDHALINEFIPREIHAKVGEPITWTMMGSDHTISFHVPKYFPILEFDTPKGVRMNPKLNRPAGGAPALPAHNDNDEGEGPALMDGGTYDGSGFWSSGLFGGDPYAQYTLRISKAGTYAYACLIHPPMIGRIVVS